MRRSQLQANLNNFCSGSHYVKFVFISQTKLLGFQNVYLISFVDAQNYTHTHYTNQVCACACVRASLSLGAHDSTYHLREVNLVLARHDISTQQ